jgi:selenocysteine-specific elongation factor
MIAPRMQIQPVVLGTAGHIDHGKSSLVRALTGIDPDRLKEERERGMTIDLGFAPFVLPNGRTVGLVDVPGHERFIRNMLAGATGIDLALLVVAADDGVMPQTREHVQIMQLLGLQHGLVALTKIDAVEPELQQLAHAELREFLRGTFLADAPIVPVSSVSGAGLADLRAAIARAVEGAPARSSGGLFRMSVQRVFSSPGHGTIATGIPCSGAIELGATLELLPGGARGRVRGLQAYHQAVARATAGHSTAINLADLPQHALRRGCVLAEPGYFRAQRWLGARLVALPSLANPIRDRTRVRVHTGTADAPGELVLLDARELEPGAQALVQLRLDEEIACAPGDGFVLRLLSPERTLGGGQLLEESEHRYKRFKSFVLEDLARRERSLADEPALLEAALQRPGRALATLEQLAREVKRPRAELESCLALLRARGAARELGRAGRWIHARVLDLELERVRAALRALQAAHAHRSVIELLALRTQLGGALREDADFLDALLAELAARGELVREAGGRIRCAGSAPELDSGLAALCTQVAERYRAAACQPPEVAELALELGHPSAQLERALEVLRDRDQLVRVAGAMHVDAAALARLREAVRANCARHGSLDIPELRDELGTTRKHLIPLLEWLDAQGLTRRVGATRVWCAR